MSCKKCQDGIVYTCNNCGGQADYDYEFGAAFCNTCEMLKEDYSVYSYECPDCNNSGVEREKKDKKYLLFFDTETTGLPKNWKSPVSDTQNWPRLVQLAYHIYDDDGNIISKHDFIVYPDGYSIPFDSTEVHGISDAQARTSGKPIQSVLSDFLEALNASHTIVGHNISYDINVVGCEFIRNGLRNPFEEINKICTMENSTNFCAINGPYGYKWPKLSELHFKLFGRYFEEAHNASIDIEATAKCFWELVNKKIITFTKKNDNTNDETIEKKKRYITLETAPISDELLKELGLDIALKSKNTEDKQTHHPKNESSLFKNINTNELIPFRKGNKWGACTKENKFIIDCDYDRVKQFSEGLSAIKKNNKWGFINERGEVIIPFDYTRATSFKNGISYVSFNSHLYKVNMNNELEFVKRKYEWEWHCGPDGDYAESIELTLEDVGCYIAIRDYGKNKLSWKIKHEGLSEINGMIPYFENEKYGYFSADFSVKIPAIYEDGYDFYDGLAFVRLNNMWGYIDVMGNQYWED